VTATRTQRVDALLVFASMAMLSVTAWVLVRSIAEGTGDETPTHVAEAPPVIDTSPFVAMRQPTPPTPAAPTGPSAPRPGVEPESTVQRLRAHTGATSFAEPQEASVMNDFLWGVYPYLCIILFFFVPVIRMITRPFSWSTRASSMFGHRLLGVASLLLHWGLFLVLAGHLAGLFGGVLGSQGAIVFFYWSGLVGGFMVLAGSLTALYRRVTSPPVRAMSQPDDYVVLLFIIAIVGLALYQVIVHRIFGVAYTASSWAASLWTLNPQPGLIMSVSLITKLHLLLALTFFAYFPFTKLVHFWTFPINYFVRPNLSMRTQHYRFQRRWEFALRSDKSWLTYGLGLVAVIFVFAGILLGRPQPSEASGITPAAADRATDDGSRLSGYPLYVSQCARCHGIAGRGNGPGANSPTFAALPRDLVAARYHFVSTRNGVASDDDLYRSIYRGLTNTGMPDFTSLTDDQILSLIDVLNGFRSGGSEPGAPIHVGTPPPATERSLARGRELYLEVCVSCHGDQGRGDGTTESYDYLQRIVVPADLAAGNIKAGDSAEQVYLRIAAGIPGGYAGTDVMLNFSKLPEADLWALVHYLKSEIMPAGSESR
jgi:nitrate reductase gamma subunit